MKQRIPTLIAIAVFLNYAIGCTSTSVATIPRDQFTVAHPDSGRNIASKKIRALYLRENDSVIFDGDGGRYYSRLQRNDSVFIGKNTEGKLVLTPLSEVVALSMDRTVFEAGNTAWALAGAAAFVALIALAPRLGQPDEIISGDARIPDEWLPWANQEK